jgi:glycosyltransferase involved in cell wall biosynthesis
VAFNPALADRAHVIPNSSVQEQDILERLPECTERLRLVYSGRLVQYQKRVLDYVDLARSLDGTGVPYEIVLVGSFPQHGDVRERFHDAAAEQLASGRIRLAGRLSRSEILAELDAADVFVLLSEFEGLPLALVEAMARGCVPVAAAMDSGIPEIVSDGMNGLIVSGRDYDSWARRIVELFRDRGRLERMSEQARTTVRESFTVEQAANRFEEIFDSVGRDAVAGTARRPPALHWGYERSRTGDVLPPPSIVRPEAVSIGGLRRWR